MIERKTKLESQRPKVQKYCDVVARMKKLHDENAVAFDRIKVVRGEAKILSDKIKKKISDKLKAFYDNKKENDPVVANLELQRQSVYDEITKNYERTREINKEWNDKYYRWEKQEKYVAYIKDAQKKSSRIAEKS